MFGQEPRLPVDFLFGRVQNPVDGSVHDWIREYKARLQLAFEGAREQLQTAAESRISFFIDLFLINFPYFRR